MLKELSVYDALYKLSQDRNTFKAYLSNYEQGDMNNIVHTQVSGVDLNHDLETGAFISVDEHRYLYCWIEVPDEYEPYGEFEKPDINVGDVLLGKREYNKGEHLVTSIYTRRDKGYRTRVDGSCQTNNMLCRDFTLSNGKPIGKPKNSNDKSIDMVYVEGGEFQMGSNTGESDEKPVHSVKVSSFYIGKYEITQKQWTGIMGSNPSYFKSDDRPVESISWYQAVEFCNKLSEKEGLTPVYTINERDITCNWKAIGYRLPTEAEWEFAARGGNKSKGFNYSGSNNIDEVAWYHTNKTQPVGTKKANELGIYDMSGNVWEWCWDWYGSYPSSANNPTGASGTKRVLRGGSWSYDARYCRGAFRRSYCPDNGGYNYGFRLVRNEEI